MFAVILLKNEFETAPCSSCNSLTFFSYHLDEQFSKKLLIDCPFIPLEDKPPVQSLYIFSCVSKDGLALNPGY